MQHILNNESVGKERGYFRLVLVCMKSVPDCLESRAAGHDIWYIRVLFTDPVVFWTLRQTVNPGTALDR